MRTKLLNPGASELRTLDTTTLARKQVICPKCGREILGAEINVATDSARCSRCAEVFPLSSFVQSNASRSVDLDDPPRGAWYRSDSDGFVVGATTRSAAAFLLVPFVCFWSVLSIGGFYCTQITQGKFNLLLSLLGLPFLVGALVLGSMASMSLFGKVVVRVTDSEGVVFTGIRSLGWRRRFDRRGIGAVRIETRSTSKGSRITTIVLDGPHPLRFGGGLSELRRDFVANVLRHEFAFGKKPRRIAE